MTIPQQQKKWWAPVWNGLVMDPDAKHYRKMKNALWLYLYLLLNANRKTGLLMRKIQTISDDMGVTRDTALRWLNVLRTSGYIATVNTGHSLTIQVTGWKPLPGVGKTQPQKSEISDFRYGKSPTPPQTQLRSFPDHNSPKPNVAAAANETKIQIILHNDLRREVPDDRSSRGFRRIGTLTQEELLAQELAKALDDTVGIRLYRSYCARYPEWLLRKVLAEVQAVPSAQITKGRGALFNYLVQHHAKRTDDDPGR